MDPKKMNLPPGGADAPPMAKQMATMGSIRATGGRDAAL